MDRSRSRRRPAAGLPPAQQPREHRPQPAAGRLGAPVNSSPQTPGGGGMGSSGGAVTLIAAGGILRFAVATPSTHGLNVHGVGLILLLAGLLGLVLSLFVWV